MSRAALLGLRHEHRSSRRARRDLDRRCRPPRAEARCASLTSYARARRRDATKARAENPSPNVMPSSACAERIVVARHLLLRMSIVGQCPAGDDHVVRPSPSRLILAQLRAWFGAIRVVPLSPVLLRQPEKQRRFDARTVECRLRRRRRAVCGAGRAAYLDGTRQVIPGTVAAFPKRRRRSRTAAAAPHPPHFDRSRFSRCSAPSCGRMPPPQRRRARLACRRHRPRAAERAAAKLGCGWRRCPLRSLGERSSRGARRRRAGRALDDDEHGSARLPGTTSSATTFEIARPPDAAAAQARLRTVGERSRSALGAR